METRLGVCLILVKNNRPHGGYFDYVEFVPERLDFIRLKGGFS